LALILLASGGLATAVNQLTANDFTQFLVIDHHFVRDRVSVPGDRLDVVSFPCEFGDAHMSYVLSSCSRPIPTSQFWLASLLGLTCNLFAVSFVSNVGYAALIPLDLVCVVAMICRLYGIQFHIEVPDV